MPKSHPNFHVTSSGPTPEGFRPESIQFGDSRYCDCTRDCLDRIRTVTIRGSASAPRKSPRNMALATLAAIAVVSALALVVVLLGGVAALQPATLLGVALATAAPRLISFKRVVPVPKHELKVVFPYRFSGNEERKRIIETIRLAFIHNKDATYEALCLLSAGKSNLPSEVSTRTVQVIYDLAEMQEKELNAGTTADGQSAFATLHELEAVVELGK